MIQRKAITSIHIAQMHIALNAHVVGLAFKLVAGAQYASFFFDPLFALNAGKNFSNSIPLSENRCSSYFFAIASVLNLIASSN